MASSLSSPTGAQHWSLPLTICLLIATFLLTRQTQIPALSGTAAPWALLLVLVWLRWTPALGALAPIAAYCALSAAASIAMGRDPTNVLRFSVITFGTLLAFHVRQRPVAVPLALLPLTAQALLLVAISAWLAYAQDPALADSVRAFVLETTWGDIYSFDGLYFRVQIIGNALIPFLFIVSLWRYRYGRVYRFMTIISLLGVVAAGNLTYYMAAGLAVLIRCRGFILHHQWTKLATAAALVFSILFGWNAVNELVDRKFEGSDSSMGVRFDQIDAATRLWGESPLTLVVGTGLGSAFPDGRERNYSEFQYIELQSLYLLVQLGVLGMLVYAVSLWLTTRRLLTADGQCIFWLYVLSGCTNPTILDTNQIVATLVLVCLYGKTRHGNRASTGAPRLQGLQPRRLSR
jgi:hypothetical protein